MASGLGTRGARRGAMAIAGAGALALAVAGPAVAADSFTNDTLPGKTVLTAGAPATTVTVTTPAGFDCASWIVRQVGQKRAVVDVVKPSLAGCTNETPLTFSVAVPATYTLRATAVIKFTVTSVDGASTLVESLVVKTNPEGRPQTGKPEGKPGKPESKPGKPEGKPGKPEAKPSEAPESPAES